MNNFEAPAQDLQPTFMKSAVAKLSNTDQMKGLLPPINNDVSPSGVTKFSKEAVRPIDN